MGFDTVVETEGHACCSVDVRYNFELIIRRRHRVLDLAFELPFAVVLLVDLESEGACKWSV